MTSKDLKESSVALAESVAYSLGHAFGKTSALIAKPIQASAGRFKEAFVKGFQDGYTEPLEILSDEPDPEFQVIDG